MTDKTNGEPADPLRAVLAVIALVGLWVAMMMLTVVPWLVGLLWLLGLIPS